MKTSQAPIDPWDALQRPGVPASDAPPPGRAIAFAAGDEAGFAMGLALPAVCLKCATTDEVAFVQDWMERNKVGRRALLVLNAFGRLESVSVRQTYGLRLPMCARCARRSDRAMKLTLAIALTPAWLMAAGVLLLAARDLVGGPVAGAVLVFLLVSVPLLALIAYVARANAVVSVSVDEERFVKLAGIHPDAGAAIERAAGVGDTQGGDLLRSTEQEACS